MKVYEKKKIILKKKKGRKKNQNKKKITKNIYINTFYYIKLKHKRCILIYTILSL